MNKQPSEINEKPTQRRVGKASAYSAQIQEVMRYDKLSSTDYHLVMTILNAVSKGDTEDTWKEEQQRTLKPLLNHSSDKKNSSTDSVNGYEQMVQRLKGLMLWPW
jgi:hypothetical protein